MPALFLLALLGGTPAPVSAKPTDMWLAGLGALVTAVYLIAIVLRPQRTRLRMGLDSRLVIAIYALGILGLAVIPNA